MFDAFEINWNESHLSSSGVNCYRNGKFSLNATTKHQTEFDVHRWFLFSCQRDRKNLITRRINILSHNHTLFWSQKLELALMIVGRVISLVIPSPPWTKQVIQCLTFLNFIVKHELLIKLRFEIEIQSTFSVVTSFIEKSLIFPIVVDLKTMLSLFLMEFIAEATQMKFLVFLWKATTQLLLKMY